MCGEQHLITLLVVNEAKPKTLMLNPPRATPRRRQTSTILLAVALKKKSMRILFNNMYHYIIMTTYARTSHKQYCGNPP